jgi:hypothetical protein
MPSQKLASGENLLKGELAAAWNILEGSSGDYTDLGIARRFGGASAAYSLRDIGAMNGKVVRVRREPHDTSAGIDDEINFSANQVQSGALEDWVNGKLESTLPADVATAAAAYSLRKVKASYSGDAVRIRRSSDDIEVDVAFDSDDKVSASSAITNVSEQGGESGSTTATTLGDFLNESNVNVGMGTNFFAQYPQVNITGTSPTGFTATVAKTTTQDVDIRAGNQVYKNVQKGTITVSFNVQQNTFSNTVSVSLWQLVHGDGYKVIGTIPAGSTGAFSFTFENTDATSGAIFRFSTPDHVVNDGEVLQVSDITIKASKHTALVHTWYDQASVNNAVQETAANQPKIAENGALITKRGQPSLKFRGTDSTPIYLDSPANITANFSFFIAAQPAADGTTFGSAGNEKRNHTLWSQGATFHMAGINSDFTNGFRHGNTILSYSAGVDFNTNLNLHSLTNGSSNVDYFGNAVNKINSTNSTSTASSYDIGRKVNITSHNTRGYISEFIHYNSDQSANRFKIESNINNYYSLYNDANDLAGNFTVDSSGSGTDASISNESKTGFTATVVDKAGFFGADLNEAVPNGSNLYISFTANLSPSGGTAATPNFGLANSADKTGNSTGNPLDTAVAEGFNSITVAGTSSTCDRIRFTEGNDNVSFVISDLKVSRIARNGFVETLYNQSGNGDDMTQATAGSQPAIVQNGGQVKLICGKPAFKGDGTDDFLEASYFYSAGEVTSLSGFTVCSNDSDTGQEEAIISAGYGLSTTYPGFTIQLDRNSNADPFEIRTANASGANETPLLSIAKDGDILGSTFFTKDDTQLVRATTKDGSSNTSEATSVGALHSNSTSGKLRIGAIRSFAVRQFFGFFISEAIVFKGSDLRDEGIENEINQFYNIG